jgi:hypothetical protein
MLALVMHSKTLIRGHLMMKSSSPLGASLAILIGLHLGAVSAPADAQATARTGAPGEPRGAAQNSLLLPARDWHGFVSYGATSGGDRVIRVTWVDRVTRVPQRSANLYAGALSELRLGVNYRPTGSTWGLQASVGRHSDYASGTDGSLDFRRTPLELLGHWYAWPQVRLGFGVRQATQARLVGKGNAEPLNTTFQASPGAVLEAEWLLLQGRLALGGRLVAGERYKAPWGEKFSGNHAGLRVSVAF